MDYSEIINQLESMADHKAVEGMAKFGITPEHAYGISMPDLRHLAKGIGRDHELAGWLWINGTREARILASLIDDPEMVDEEQMEKWAADFDYWEICDQVCINLFGKTSLVWQKAIEWSGREEESYKRAGFVLMTRIAISDKKATDEQFEPFFPLIIKQSDDQRNLVRKSVNWALRQIGKRNLILNSRAIEVAQEIQNTNSKTAKWIASDAIRELKSEAVQKRLIK